MSRLAATDKTKAVKSDDFVWHVTQAARAIRIPANQRRKRSREHFAAIGKPLETANGFSGYCLEPFGITQLSTIGPASGKTMVRHWR